ncbi:hypothetical protein HPB48_014397 [Haemaphysalis longicornis]|uniref:Uncharacterized protein n=1 Tax=Haemaphysalis longicornis TaxID=44386 RepID=A0A9J6GSN2_HAELO|nr:hypothetical protein HPB48_014397 [Haemaphysalis longicornis]
MNRPAEIDGEAEQDSTGIWQACGRVYGKLARDSGLPGADALVTGGPIRRLLWMGALVTLCYYSTKETSSILREYFTYKVAVAFEYNTNVSFQMPDVTICNINPMRKSKLCALDSSERDMKPDLELRLCGEQQEFSEVSGTRMMVG